MDEQFNTQVAEQLAMRIANLEYEKAQLQVHNSTLQARINELETTQKGDDDANN